MKKVIIASTNPVKTKAVKQAFSKVFKNKQFIFQSIAVNSGVPDQPIGNKETLQGAKNRVQESILKIPQADFYVGIEGGIIPFIKNQEQTKLSSQIDNMETMAWVFISSQNLESKAKTASFFLPPRLIELVKQGKELGEASNIVFKGEDIKRKNGTVGILTNDLIDRTSYYISAVILALIPFKNFELYC